MRHIAKLGLKFWIDAFFLCRITYPGDPDKSIRLTGIMDSERNIMCQSTLICNCLSNYKHAKCNKIYKNESS